MAEMHLKQSGFTYGVCRPFPKSKERLHKQKKQETQKIFIKTNQIKLAFNVIWLVDILKI